MIRANRFQLLIVATAGAVYGLIVFGGVVRVTDSGMGCGPDWPLCNGEIIPSVWTMETALEYLHRVFAALVILFTGLLLVAGWFRRRANRWFFILPLMAVGFVLLQSGLGAITVLLDLHAHVTTAHHLMAQVFLGTLLVLAVLSFQRQNASNRPRGTGLTPVAALAGTSVLALMTMGAYTATKGAGYACPEWPLCSGYYFPGTGSSYVDVQLLHRWLAVIASLAIGLVVYQAYRSRRDDGQLTGLALGTGALMGAQVMIGAANIWTQLSPWVSALHLAVATVIWGVLVVIVTLDRIRPASHPVPVPLRIASLEQKSTQPAGD
jgi:heme A synthase